MREIIEQYFKQTDSPSADSPVGLVMHRVLVKFPGITFQAAREKAHQLLDDAAKRKVFRVLVFSEAETAEKQIRLASYWKRRSETVKDAA
jgi:hypothetical protein